MDIILSSCLGPLPRMKVVMMCVWGEGNCRLLYFSPCLSKVEAAILSAIVCYQGKYKCCKIAAADRSIVGNFHFYTLGVSKRGAGFLLYIK